MYSRHLTKIIGARWTPTINMIQIKCSCSSIFEHRADRWTVRCPSCSRQYNIQKLRDKYLEVRRRNEKRRKIGKST